MRKSILALATVGALAGTALPLLAWERDDDYGNYTGIGITIATTTVPTTGAMTMMTIVGRIASIIGGGGGGTTIATTMIGRTNGATTDYRRSRMDIIRGVLRSAQCRGLASAPKCFVGCVQR